MNWLVGLYMLLCLMFFCWPAFAFDWKRAWYLAEKKAFPWNLWRLNFLNLALIFYIAIAFIAVIIFLMQQGFSSSTIFTKPLDVANRVGALRYANALNLSIYSILATVMVYPVAFIAGMLFRLSDIGKIPYVLAGLSVPAFVMIVQSSKGMFFLSIAFFYCGFLVARSSSGDYRLFPRLGFLWIAIITCAGFSLIWYSFISRGLSELSVDDQISSISAYFLSYCCSHMYAFSDWLSDRYFGHALFNYDQPFLSLGNYTFRPLLELAGVEHALPQGTYNEYFYDHNFRPGNVYTVFRGLISDFSIVGSVFIFSFFGFLANHAYLRILCKSTPVGAWVVYLIFFASAYQSYAASTLSWSSTYIAFAIIYLTLRVLFLKVSS